jgi:hypothetical protein
MELPLKLSPQSKKDYYDGLARGRLAGSKRQRRHPKSYPVLELKYLAKNFMVFEI